jgi:hypothetical protein
VTTTTLVEVPSSPGYAGATLHLAIDDTEHQRRQAAGIGTIIGNGFVRRAPAAICTIHQRMVTRHAIRPCRVTLATVRARHAGKLALDSASRFAPFCARQVIVEKHPQHPRRLRDDLHGLEILLEFEFYGIGLAVENADGTTETLVDPRPWRPKRHTAAAWWFAETAYRQYLDTLTTPQEA